MPLPKPRAGETQEKFVSRCIEFETTASPDRKPEQIQAMCYQTWRDRFKDEHTQEASDTSWASVDKSKLPASCFLWVEDPKKKSTWHLPVYMGTGGINPETGMYRARGEINLGALRAASAAIAGARSGKAMNVPSSVKAKLNALLKKYKIGQYAES